MIDFPTLFPSLVKYIPNWMEKFYPRMAQFARGEGYPCGNKGVFIPRRNKCWTHPKTGNKLKQPLTYQKYQEAKEKSQRSRTEAGRTALQNREQGFRDKAREKVKGWQNKKVEPVKEQSGKIEIKGIETESKTKPVPELLAKRLEKKGFKRSEINIEVRGGKTKIEAMAKGDLAIHPNYKQDEVDGYSVTHIPSGKQFNTFKHGSGYMVNTLKGAENQAVKMIDLIEPLDLKNKDLNSKQLHDVRVGLIQAKWEMDKEGAEKEAKSQEDWDAKEKAEKLPLATEPKPKPEPKPEPKPIAEVKKPERFGDTAYDVDGKWIGYPGDEEKAQKNAANKAKRKAFESDVASFLKENKIDWASSHQHGINTTPARLASLTKILDDKGIEYTTDHSNVWNVKIKIKSLTPKKKDFNAKIKLANFSQPKNKMIDFPSLYPSLVKYIPNWLERFYPSLAQFARGEGYPCGNNGVFIPRRNKCWKHPKTGQRMRKPLTYQNYQDAKEKSQRSRTEKGRTALANREQSFRDKAREKVKGWQNKTPESEVALKVGTKQVNIVGSPELYKELNLTHDPSLGWQLTNKKGDVLRQPKDGQLQPTHRFKEKSQAENFAKQVIAKVDRMTGKPAEAKMRDTLKKAIADNKLNKSLANTAYEKYHQHQNGMKHQAEGLSSRSVASLYEIPHATAVARINGLREAVGLGPSSAVSVDKELGERINDLLNDGKQIKINSSVGGLRDQKKEPSQTTIGADKKWSDFLESKNVTEKGLRKLDPETRKKITEEFENIRIEERAQESSKRKGLSLPEEPKPTPNSTGVKGAGGKRETDIKDTAPPTPKLKSKDHAANEKYDQWLISESQKLEGKEKNYSIGTESGKKSVRGKVYENFGIHEDRGRYNLTQLSSGKMLSYYDNEDQAKKSIVELNRSGGIDWKTKDLESIPGIQTKMKSVKRKIGAVIESDKRAKELIESMMRSHEKESWDRSDDLAGYGVKVPKKQKNNFNSNLKIANFSQPKNKMIDFPSLYPNLVKYIPNWLERFYPTMAQFARGEGYPCGNKGVFIPRRNKCWTHPKTGQRMRKPLTYQNYQDAKEKSQRSRTEKGRTALANREQSFRDKAREKAKGWQNKTPESAESKQAVLDIERIKSGQHVINKRDGYSLAYRGRGVYDLNDLDVPKGWRAKPTKLTEKEATDFLADKYKSMSGIKPDPKPTPNSTGVKDAGGKTFDLNDLWRQTADAAYSKNKDGVSKNLEQWKEVVKKLESGEGISKDVNLNEYEKLMDNLEKKLVLDPKDPSNVEFKKITGSIYRTLNKAVRRDQLTQEDLEKAHPNFRPIMQRMKKTFAKQNELSDKRQQSQKELDLLKHRQSYNESIVRSNSRQFREMGIDNNYNELRLLTKRNPNDMVEVRNPVSNLPERTVTLPERLNEINRDIRDLSDDKKAQISQDRAKEEIARLQKPIKDSEGRVSSLTSEIKALRESRGEPDSPKRKRAKKNDFNSNLKLTQFGGNNLRILKSKLANFAKPGCCCDASKPLKRRKTKQTPRLKRRGNKYA